MGRGVMEDRLVLKSKYINTIDSTTTNFMKDVSNGPLTLNKNYAYLSKSITNTPFTEVDILDWRQVFDIESINSFINSSNRTAPLKLNKVLDTMYEYIYNTWDISKFNVMFHSSGYDSRILSHMIKRVYDERGGNILFVCFPNEENLMADIMRYEGWDDSQFTFYTDYLSEDTEAFDFKYLFEQFNSPSAFPFSRPYSCIKYLKKTEVIPKENLCLWGGAFFNETFKAKGTLPTFIKTYYYHRYSKSGFEDTPQHPIVNFDTLKVIYEARPSSSPDSTRLALVKLLDKNLASLARGSWLTPKTILNPKIYNKLVNDYKNSFYYKNIDQEFDPAPCVADNKEWWYKCSLASYIDYYIENDVEINY